MSDAISNDQDGPDKIKVFLSRRDAIRNPNEKFELMVPQQAHVSPPRPCESISADSTKLFVAFKSLWDHRKTHGVQLRASPQWESGERPYGNLSKAQLPKMKYRFYYVENDVGRNMIIITMLNGNIAVCHRSTNDEFCMDYIVPDIGFKHPLLGHLPVGNADINFIVAAMSEMYDNIKEPPTFMPLF